MCQQNHQILSHRVFAEMVDDHRIDVRDIKGVQAIFEQTQPNFVFHLAAQALSSPLV